MKEIKGFRNSHILTEQGIIKTNLLIENGIIKKIGDFECDGLIELPSDRLVIPGFIDEHIHGTCGSDVIDGSIEALENISNSLVKEGTTAFLATTTTISKDILEKTLNTVNEYILNSSNKGATIIGVHLEGPFISKKYLGAQLGEFVERPAIELFNHYNNISGNNIKLVSYAVEEDLDFNFTKYLKSLNITPSIGHSAASYNDIVEAVSNGLSCSTHTYNAQRGIHHREVGTVGGVMLLDDIYTEVICDFIHVSYPAIKLLLKNKPYDKIILVTDSLRPKFLSDGKYIEPGGQVIIVSGGVARLEDGTIAGSMLKMNQAVFNMIKYLGVSMVDAVKFATANPAKNLGVFDKMGSIEEGKCANLLVVDQNINIYKTIRNGFIVYESEEE